MYMEAMEGRKKSRADESGDDPPHMAWGGDSVVAMHRYNGLFSGSPPRKPLRAVSAVKMCPPCQGWDPVTLQAYLLGYLVLQARGIMLYDDNVPAGGCDLLLYLY